jgi:hypothetical protein
MKTFFYEILNQINDNPKEAKSILLDNNTPYLRQLLQLSFHPDIHFYPKAFPKEYKEPDTQPGISFSDLQSELKRIYLFQRGNPTADILTEEKRTTLLLQMLESFEPREAQVLINVFKKDLKTKGLTYSLVKETFPGLIP